MQVISTNNLYQTTVGEALDVQSRWATAETQQASGLKASDFGSLGGADTRETLNLEGDIAQATSWAAVAQTTGATTQAMFTAVGAMQQDLNKVQVLISSATSSPNNSDLLGQAQVLMNQLLTQMNQQVGGAYLFAGSNSSLAPVDLTHYPTLAVGTDGNGNPTYSYDPDTADTSYYTGDNKIQSVQINMQQTLSYGVLGSNPIFEESIRAVQQVIEAAQVSSSATESESSASQPSSVSGGTLTINGQDYTVNGGDSLDQIAASINAQAGTLGSGVAATVVPDTDGQFHLRLTNGQDAMTIDDQSGLGLSSAAQVPDGDITDALKSALTTTNQAVADLGNLQEDISNTSSTLNDAQTSQTSFVTYLQTSLSSVKDVDTAQTAAQVQQYQTQLQASFLAVSTLTKLNLASML